MKANSKIPAKEVKIGDKILVNNRPIIVRSVDVSGDMIGLFFRRMLNGTPLHTIRWYKSTEKIQKA